MCTKAGQMTAVSPDRVLYEKSVYLRVYSNALLRESRDLCHHSRRLRAMNRLRAGTNPNVALNRDSIWASVFRSSSSPQISFSIDIPLLRFKQDSNERHLKVFKTGRVL